ncbi:hypothetical protein, partial [Actinomadura nitritigenes]|uniref:hypothetical protein n=1 Tax=Actinomadura nitritigenes TaxID=134602 RepID=UPI0031D52739
RARRHRGPTPSPEAGRRYSCQVCTPDWWGGLELVVTRRPNTDPDRTGELARRWPAEVTAERPGLERRAVTATRLAGVRIDHGEKTSID